MRAVLLLVLALAAFVVWRNKGPEVPSDTTERIYCPILRVVVFQDKTDSGNQNRTPQIEASDLRPIVEHVQACGGEVAVGLVGVDSNRPLLRLYVLPVDVEVPKKPSTEGNPFYVEEALRKYETDKAGYDEAEAARQRRAEADVEAFLVDVEALLASAPDQMRTDVWGAVGRGAYLFGEPAGTWPRSTQDALVMVTDAEDNAASERVPLPPNVTVYLVNGNPTLGELEDLDPIRVEAFDVAVRSLLQRAEPPR